MYEGGEQLCSTALLYVTQQGHRSSLSSPRTSLTSALSLVSICSTRFPTPLHVCRCTTAMQPASTLRSAAVCEHRSGEGRRRARCWLSCRRVGRRRCAVQRRSTHACARHSAPHAGRDERARSGGPTSCGRRQHWATAEAGGEVGRCYECARVAVSTMEMPRMAKHVLWSLAGGPLAVLVCVCFPRVWAELCCALRFGPHHMSSPSSRPGAGHRHLLTLRRRQRLDGCELLRSLSLDRLVAASA